MTQHVHQGPGVLGVIPEFCLPQVLDCSWPGSGQGREATVFSHKLREGKEKPRYVPLKIDHRAIFLSTSLWACKGLCDVWLYTKNSAVWIDSSFVQLRLALREGGISHKASKWQG